MGDPVSAVVGAVEGVEASKKEGGLFKNYDVGRVAKATPFAAVPSLAKDAVSIDKDPNTVDMLRSEADRLARRRTDLLDEQTGVSARMIREAPARAQTAAMNRASAMGLGGSGVGAGMVAQAGSDALLQAQMGALQAELGIEGALTPGISQGYLSARQLELKEEALDAQAFGNLLKAGSTVAAFAMGGPGGAGLAGSLFGGGDGPGVGDQIFSGIKDFGSDAKSWWRDMTFPGYGSGYTDTGGLGLHPGSMAQHTSPYPDWWRK